MQIVVEIQSNYNKTSVLLHLLINIDQEWFDKKIVNDTRSVWKAFWRPSLFVFFSERYPPESQIFAASGTRFSNSQVYVMCKIAMPHCHLIPCIFPFRLLCRCLLLFLCFISTLVSKEGKFSGVNHQVKWRNWRAWMNERNQTKKTDTKEEMIKKKKTFFSFPFVLRKNLSSLDCVC